MAAAFRGKISFIRWITRRRAKNKNVTVFEWIFYVSQTLKKRCIQTRVQFCLVQKHLKIAFPQLIFEFQSLQTSISCATLMCELWKKCQRRLKCWISWNDVALHRCRSLLEFHRVFLVAQRTSCETMCSTSKWKQQHSHWLKYIFEINLSLFVCVTHNSFNYSIENDTICSWLYYWVSISPFVPRVCVCVYFSSRIAFESIFLSSQNFLQWKAHRYTLKSMRHMFERKTLWSCFFLFEFEGSISTSPHALHNRHLYWWNIYHCWYNSIRIDALLIRRLYIWSSIMNRTY